VEKHLLNGRQGLLQQNQSLGLGRSPTRKRDQTGISWFVGLILPISERKKVNGRMKMISERIKMISERMKIISVAFYS
jgi:hypothetical protein